MHEVKRRYRRFRVENMNLSAKALFAADTELMNISVGGACIKAVHSLKAADKQLVRLGSGRAPLALSCSLIWEDAPWNPADAAAGRLFCYRSGVSFMSVPPDKLVKLKDFIRESGVPSERKDSDSFKPSMLRFLLHRNKKAVLYYRKTLAVKIIGIGGMLVETCGDIRPGEVLPMELLIPDEDRGVRFRGRITSRLPADGADAGRFNTGIEFLGMAVSDMYRLSRFLLLSGIPAEA
jgi:hypothetical protein